MSREVIAPDNVFKARGYSHAFKVGNTIYVAGQAPFDQDMRLSLIHISEPTRPY